MDNTDHIHPDRRRRKTHDDGNRAGSSKKKYQKPRPTPAASSSLSAQNLKKKIRDESRLLVRPSTKLPATARAEHERALEAYKHELSVIKQNRKKEGLRKKYHMVRFFERQKASRKVNQCRKKLSSSSPSSASELHEAEVDLAYVLHYPDLEKYISLYRRDGKGTSTDEKRMGIRRRIEEDMATGRISLNGSKERRKKGGRRVRVDDGSAGGMDEEGDIQPVGKRKKEEVAGDDNDDDDFFEFS